ncbi:glycan-binding surface protein [uncultured Bacteroides sp.]|jgi:hypothetical protein|uniref:glycan-binding surface protein n=1 Tax=uncultured Bacteroides sp. TaxID=162156 RepID=UPI00258786AF|nr:glycan-binding surface protein [uncultured Bacteroides sp.]
MMKTIQYLKYNWLFSLVVIMSLALVACSDEDEYNKQDAGSDKVLVESIRVQSDNLWTPAVQVRVGTTVRIEGNNMEKTSAVYFNGYEVLAENFTNIGKTYIETVVPETTPIGHQVTDESIKNTVRVVTDINEFTSQLNIISKSLNVSGIALYANEEASTPGSTVTEAELGSKIQIQGAGLDFVTAVYFNGKATTEKFMSQSAVGITLHIPNDTPLGSNVINSADRNTITVETEFGEKFIHSFTIKGNPPTFTEVRSSDGFGVVTKAKGGETIRLIGRHLETVTSIYCNGKELTTFEATPEYILLPLPKDLPVGSAVTTENVRNKIRVVSEFGEATLEFEFRGNGAVPVIDRVSHTLAKAGERIELLGANFIDIEKIVFPGEVEADLETMTVSSDNKALSVLVPEGGDQTAGAIRVEGIVEGINGMGHSYSYVNCRSNIFIEKFSGDSWGTHQAGTRISSNLSTAAGVVGEWPQNPATYRAFPADGTLDYKADGTDDTNNNGYYSFKVQKAWQHLLDNNALDGTVNCNDLAVQFDCWMSCKWTAGALRFAFKGDNEISFVPWHAGWNDEYKTVDVDFSKGWKTFTFPLSEMASVAGQTVEQASASTENGRFTFIFGRFNYSSWSRGEAMNGFRICFGNFRIVPYTKEN